MLHVRCEVDRSRSISHQKGPTLKMFMMVLGILSPYDPKPPGHPVVQLTILTAVVEQPEYAPSKAGP